MNAIVKSSNGINLISLDTCLFDKRKVFLEGEINADQATELVKELLDLNEERNPIDLYINSQGGSVSAGLAIYDMIRASKAPIRTFCIGECYSIAALIFSSGTAGRYMLANSKLMLHEPLLGRPVTGNVSSIHSLYETMNTCKEKLSTIFAENTGKTVEEINALTTHDHYFNASEAIAYGLADGIADYETMMGGN